MNLPDWCCASGCKNCPAFRSAHAYCAKCETRSARDENGCVTCWALGQDKRDNSANRRAVNRAQQRCINQPLFKPVPHGPPVRGGKCEACLAVHARSR